MKRILYILAAVAVVAAALFSRSTTLRYEKVECSIAMRDSVHLHAAIYKPRWGKNHPILVMRTPYSCAPYGDDFLDYLNENYLYRNYLRHGYILVFQDVRGRFMSEGEFENLRPALGTTNEATDAYDTVDWLVKNIDGNNGRVGFYGCSYPGFYATYAALCNHPAVKAVSPQAPVTDWFMGDDVHHNGVMMLADSFNLMPMFSHTNHTPTTEWLPTLEHDNSPDQYTYFLNATRDSLRSIMHPSTFWDIMAEHPDYDEWWQQRDVRQYLYNITPAVLVVGGVFDAEDCFGAWNTYRAIRTQSPATDCRLVIGPWAHGAWSHEDAEILGDFNFGSKASAKYYADNFELPFFEYHLRGKGTLDAIPQESLFLSGSNSWVSNYDNLTRQTFYLDNGTLTTKMPAEQSSCNYTSDPSNPVPYDSQTIRRRREYMVADQRFAAEREDVVRYISEPLSEDTSFVGNIDVKLDVAITTTDADFAVRVIDLFPADDRQYPDYQMLVRGDIMRARYRNSFTDPTPMTPNQMSEVAFTLPGIAHTFKAGHRIMVCVQGSWYPLAERSPQQFVNLWHCNSSDFVPTDVKIFNSSTITFNKL